MTFAYSVLNSFQSFLLLKTGQEEPYHFQDFSIHQPIQKGLLNTKIQSFKAHSVTGPPPKSLNVTDNNKLHLNGLWFKALLKSTEKKKGKNKDAVMKSLNVL